MKKSKKIPEILKPYLYCAVFWSHEMDELMQRAKQCGFAASIYEDHFRLWNFAISLEFKIFSNDRETNGLWVLTKMDSHRGEDGDRDFCFMGAPLCDVKYPVKDLHDGNFWPARQVLIGDLTEVVSACNHATEFLLHFFPESTVGELREPETDRVCPGDYRRAEIELIEKYNLM